MVTQIPPQQPAGSPVILSNPPYLKGSVLLQTTPFLLSEADSIRLNAAGGPFARWLADIFLGAWLGFVYSLLPKILSEKDALSAGEHHAWKFGLAIVVVAYLISFFATSEKRAVLKRIKKHFASDKPREVIEWKK